MKKLIFLGACLVALASQPVRAQTGEPAVVVVRIVEEHPSAYLRIIIARGTGKPEEIGVKNKQLGGEAGTEASQKVFADLYAQGYKLKSSYGGGDRVASFSTLVFTREP
jgi:hypothetical protein